MFEYSNSPDIFLKEEDIPFGSNIIEAYTGALKELFFINNPQWKKEDKAAQASLQKFLAKPGINPIWIYYSNEKIAVRTVPEKEYFKLRTSRNRDIITNGEQTRFRNTVVGIAGLSVGSAIVHALVMSGGPKKMKIADFDEIEITNLNRIRANLRHIGENKTHVAAQEIWSIDPFAQLNLFDNGLTVKNLEDFIITKPRLDIFIDEMDSLDLKIRSRLIAREYGIPVLMATDNGNSIILDIERFDLEPKRKIFHGFIKDVEEINLESLNFNAWLKLATKIVGPEYLTERMQDSLMNIGKKISSVPQLGPTAAMAGTAIAFAVRQIANKYDLPSGRYGLGCEEKLIPEYNSKINIRKREERSREFIKKFRK